MLSKRPKRVVNRVINMGVLPGEPLDGRGRVCVHLFVQDERGPFVDPHVLHPVIENGAPVKQKVQAKPTRGRLACDSRRSVAPVTRNGVTTVTVRTDDPRSVSCPKCKATPEYTAMMAALNQE